MIRDALLDGPPAETGAHCYVCGCWTTVPVVIGYSGSVAHHVCPRHVLVAGGERGTGRARGTSPGR
ncbi:hypothetical protein JNUCC64_12970 [Streptomyces sp. JNUCC 64]